MVEHGGFTYSADGYADDLPYYVPVRTRLGVAPLLVVPYTLDVNDMRFATPQGFNSGDQFFTYLKDTFDLLYAEGDPKGLDAPKMMSVGLHCRIVGPSGTRGRTRTLPRLRAAARGRVGGAARRHRAPLARDAPARGDRVLTLAELNAMDEDRFVATLGGIFEHSPWVAQRAFGDRPFASVAALHAAMVAAVDRASEPQKLALLREHPELAGKAAVRGEMTDDSKQEQSGAGLSNCSPQEFARLTELNARYNARFGFPFILAVKGYDRAGIIGEFERRVRTSARRSSPNAWPRSRASRAFVSTRSSKRHRRPGHAIVSGMVRGLG